MTLHIVTGYMRSGTTMMMNCLEAGGMVVIENRWSDQWAAEHSHEVEWDINPGRRIREPGPVELASLSHRAAIEHWGNRGNMAIKVLVRALDHLHSDTSTPMKFVVMRRHPAEIRVSARAARIRPAPTVTARSYDRLERRLRAFPGTESVVTLDYTEVVSRPLEQMNRLVDAGWPINPSPAAGVPDELWYRHRYDPDAPLRRDPEQLGVDARREADLTVA